MMRILTAEEDEARFAIGLDLMERGLMIMELIDEGMSLDDVDDDEPCINISFPQPDHPEVVAFLAARRLQ